MKQINQTSFISWIFLLSLATIWGVNFLFIKLAVEDIGPITNVFLRLSRKDEKDKEGEGGT